MIVEFYRGLSFGIMETVLKREQKKTRIAKLPPPHSRDCSRQAEAEGAGQRAPRL